MQNKVECICQNCGSSIQDAKSNNNCYDIIGNIYCNRCLYSPKKKSRPIKKSSSVRNNKRRNNRDTINLRTISIVEDCKASSSQIYMGDNRKEKKKNNNNTQIEREIVYEFNKTGRFRKFLSLFK